MVEQAGPNPEVNHALRDPDVRLMLRVKEGDEAAFAELVTSYQERLINVLRHLLRGADVAEDVAQEVFLRIYKARNGYEPTAKFSTWLFKIANNLASNRRRSSGRKKEVNRAQGGSSAEQSTDERLLADRSALLPTRQLDKTEIREMVRNALDSLSDRQRVAVLLHKFEEMSYADIGSTMDMSAAAVKSLLSRARENLRERLEPYVKQGHLILASTATEEEE